MRSPSLPVNVTLIGYRGTGKTSVAQRLALLIGWSWIDADVEVELSAGKSIAAIFAEEGEAAFRDRETEVLRCLYAASDRILALGGGAVLREENRRLIQGGGATVWLTASPEVILARLEADPTTPSQRPDLTAKGGLQEIMEVMQQRSNLYQQCADLVVDTEEQSPDAVADQIMQWLKEGPSES